MTKKRISHYEILELIGEGGMGVVYRALDLDSEKTVALKILSKKSLIDEELKRRFFREAGAGQALDHLNIVKIFEVGEEEGEYYISMELIDGKTLRQVLSDGLLVPQQVIDIGIGVCEALNVAHGAGITHRDIKSENIMITAGGDVKVMDFGLAKNQNASLLTQEGSIVGTVAYMSPQQAAGEPIDHRSDIFSLGVVLYELLTGTLPFGSDYELSVIYSILNEEPAPVRDLNKDVPEVLEQVITKALRKELSQRYQSIEEMSDDLRKIRSFLRDDTGKIRSIVGLIADTEVTSSGVKVAQSKYDRRKGFQSRLVGREEEFELLREKLSLAGEGKGNTVLIAGEAGIGKSRLVSELEKYARTIKVTTLTGRCVYRQGTYPYQPFVEAIRNYFDIKGVTSSRRLEEFIREKAPDLLPRLPVIRIILNLKETEKIEIESKEQIWDAIFQLIMKISRERMIILFLDDLHWADEDTIQLLQYTVRNIVQSNILILGTYRPEDVQQSGNKVHPLIRMQSILERDRLVTIVRLERLKHEHVEGMIQSVFRDADFGQSFYESLYRETEGNPFFVMEMLKLLKSEEAIVKDNGSYRLREEFDRLLLPSRVQDIVVRRVERLTEEEREILEIGAVVGEAFHSETIRNCLEIEKLSLLRKLQRLERDHQIIFAQDKLYRFDHSKIREALYDAITPELRVEYHLMIGNHLESLYSHEKHQAPQIAHHYNEGGEIQKALPYLIVSGEHAGSMFANDQAVSYYSNVLGIIRQLEYEINQEELDRYEQTALEGIGDICALTGSFDAALENYEMLIAKLRLDDLRRSELLRKVSEVHFSKGETGKTMETLTVAEEILNKLPDDLDQVVISRGKVKITRARLHKAQGHHEDARRVIEEGLKLLGHKGNVRERADAYRNLGVLYYDQGNYDVAIDLFNKSLELRELILDKKGMGETYTNLAGVYYDKGNYEKAVEMFEKGLSIMREIGFRVGIAGGFNNLGITYQDIGRYEDSRIMHEKSLEIRLDIGDLAGVAMSYANLGSTHIDIQDYEKARQLLGLSIEIQKEKQMRALHAQTFSWLAEALARLGEFRSAEETAQRAIDYADEMNQKSLKAKALRALCVAVTEKRKQSDFANSDDEEIDRISGIIEESIKICGQLNMEHELGRSSLEYARFLSTIKDNEKAKTYVAKAKDIFNRLGALGDLKKAEELDAKLSS